MEDIFSIIQSDDGINKFWTNNDASWMKEDEEEDEDEECSLLTS